MSDAERVYGYAVVMEGNIDVSSVSPTRRGALVNWLAVGPPNLNIRNDFSDSFIEELWRIHGPNCGAKVGKVRIDVENILLDQ